MMTWTDEQIDAWCVAFRSYREDTSALRNARELQLQRHPVRQEMLQRLTAFLDGRSTLQEFNAVFQQPARPDWNLFGTQGFSGSSFLNKLVKALPCGDQLTQQLRSALGVPKDMWDGHDRMQSLFLFLERMIVTGQISRGYLQPARLPFFLSVWWHIQDEEQWPRFAGDLRQSVLRGLPLTDPVGNQISLYFAFRERFLALKTAFGISAWELEHFLLWQKQQEQEKELSGSPATQKGERIASLNEASRRLHLQWLLAKIGKKVGCQVWIARQDHQKCWKDELLGQISVSSLPALDGVSDAAVLEDVAVLWLRKNEVVAAYEVVSKDGELTANILRLYDLGLTRAKHQTRLCLVLPNKQFEHVYRELSRPLFRQQQERHQCALISEENLTQNGEHILRWATSPTVLEDVIISSNESHG